MPKGIVPNPPAEGVAPAAPESGAEAPAAEVTSVTAIADPEATVAGVKGGKWVSVDGAEQHTADPQALQLSADDVDIIGDALVGSSLGSYRLLDLLGEGGMGKVYLAEHTKIGRKVAIKLLRSQYASRHDIVTRFFQEARAVNQIRHENIIDITDFVEDDRGYSYLVMELLTGIDLGHLIRQEWPLPVTRVLHLFVQICDGLAAAHEVGIVHRDLKPDNVFLVERSGRRDFVKLVDFGVAKLLGDALSADYGGGGVIGTPAYMSPEQASGNASVDHRADIYALGAMLYRLFTGRPPFRGSTIEDYIRAHISETPLPPSQVEDLPVPMDREVEEIILRCLEKNPDDRFQSMYELRAALDQILRMVPQRPDAPMLPLYVAEGSEGGRGVKVVAALAVAGLLAAGGVAGFYLLGRGESPATAESVALPATAAPATAMPTAAPETAEPAPEKTLVSFASRPLGAEVWRSGEEEGTPLGVTPFQAPFEPQDEEAEFVFRLRGYESALGAVSLADSARLEVTLSKAVARPGRRSPVRKPKAAVAKDGSPGKAKDGSPGKKKKLDSHMTYDPFGGK